MRRLALLLLAFIALLAQAEPFSYRRITVADGIYAFVEDFGHAIVSGNSTLIVGDEGAVVVDTGHHPALTRRIIEEIRALTPKPVHYVVNTHWHNDHVSGNSLYAEAFPGVKFIAQRATAELMETETRAFQQPASCQSFIRVQSKALRESLASGVGPDGTPLTDARRKRLQSVVEDADAAAAECLEFRYRGADIAFDERLTLKLGKREVQVMFLGRANTAGDAVVYVPDAKVLALGDILVHPFPFAYQSFIGEWAAVLRRIEAMDAVAIVPGHGPVMRDRKYLAEVAALMQAIEAQAKAAYRPGMTLEELRTKIDLAAFRTSIAGTDPVLQANFDASVAGAAVARAWQALQGKLEPEGLPKG